MALQLPPYDLLTDNLIFEQLTSHTPISLDASPSVVSPLFGPVSGGLAPAVRPHRAWSTVDPTFLPSFYYRQTMKRWDRDDLGDEATTGMFCVVGVDK